MQKQFRRLRTRSFNKLRKLAIASENGEFFKQSSVIASIMNHDIFYEAMLARDYRFDGKLYIGVKTTGNYCRPICPAKPKRENVEFFLTATAAEKSGYRPCLRCRPECAPFHPLGMGGLPSFNMHSKSLPRTESSIQMKISLPIKASQIG